MKCIHEGHVDTSVFKGVYQGNIVQRRIRSKTTKFPRGLSMVTAELP